MYGVCYDTSFAPQDPAAAPRAAELDIEVEKQSPVATLRLLNRLLPDEYLKLMQVLRVSPHVESPSFPFDWLLLASHRAEVSSVQQGHRASTRPAGAEDPVLSTCCCSSHFFVCS